MTSMSGSFLQHGAECEAALFGRRDLLKEERPSASSWSRCLSFATGSWDVDETWDVSQTWLPQLLCFTLDKHMQQPLKVSESSKIGPWLQRSFVPHGLAG